MLLKELSVFLLYYFEVSTVTIYLALALIGVKPGLKKILTMGFLLSFTAFVVRYTYSVLDIPLGSHIVFSILAFILFSRYMVPVGWGLSVAVAMIALTATVLSEALLYPVFLKYLSITFEDMFSNLWLHVLGGYFGNLLVFILALIVGITGFSLIKTDK